MDPYLTALLKDGTTRYVGNVKTEFSVSKVGNCDVPVTVNQSEWDNSWVCSPYSHFVSYPLDYGRQLSSPWGKVALQIFPRMLSPFLELGEVNRIVGVNNWLYPTILYPTFTSNEIRKLKETLVTKYPTHAYLFRSVNPFSNPNLTVQLKKEGFQLIPCRQVYMIDPSKHQPFDNRCFHKDAKLLSRTSYRILKHEEIPMKAALRIWELYHQLNIEKYSLLNPQYTKEFVSYAIKNKVLEFIALEKGGKIDAVVAFWVIGNVMTAPFSGYDTTRSKHLGLYRLLSHLLLLEAKKRNLILNQSAGAGSFKKLRKAKPVIEYDAVYTQHLPMKNRISWNLLKKVVCHIGVPFMKQFG